MKLSVIVRTRNPESWLDKTLTGFALQARRDFEVIVAEEGGSRSTSELVAGRRQGYPVPLRHVRCGDAGGSEAIGQAIRAAAHDYVLMTNSNCIPCRDFVAVHAGLAGPGRFLSAGCCRVDGELGRRVSRNDIVRGHCFELDWLQSHGRMAAADRRRLGGSPMVARLLEALTPAAPTFNACNASAWKDDLLAACDDTAADDDSADGGLGRRLEAMGVRGRRIRQRAVCLHLGHADEGGDAAAHATTHAVASRSRGERVAWTRPACE
ncbi:MAG: glycosyltransferase [Luteimonas sp.]